MIFTKGQIGPRRKVLIFGIDGGVAVASLQLAKLVGAEVAVTSRGSGKLKQAEQLGADLCIGTDDDVVGDVMRWTDKQGVDLVIDNVGQATWPKSMRSVRTGAVSSVVARHQGARLRQNCNAFSWGKSQYTAVVSQIHPNSSVYSI